jgi:hypothetical protein
MIQSKGALTICGVSILCSIAAYMSHPLVSGWQDDPSLRFGLVSFFLWLAAVIAHWSLHSVELTIGQGGFLVAASMMLFGGIVGELQALVYLALAGYLCLPVRAWYGRICLVLASVFWMPAWAWLVSPVFKSQTAICSLVLAIIVLIISMFIKVRPIKT